VDSVAFDRAIAEMKAVRIAKDSADARKAFQSRLVGRTITGVDVVVVDGFTRDAFQEVYNFTLDNGTVMQLYSEDYGYAQVRLIDADCELLRSN